MTTFLKCPKCGGEMTCLGGASAHITNWYCNDDNCGFTPWDSKPEPEPDNIVTVKVSSHFPVHERYPTFDTAPRDGRPIQAYHIIHKCWVSVRRNKAAAKISPTCEWQELTHSNSWPKESFSHWTFPLPAPVKR